jgi:hypothetical protein
MFNVTVVLILPTSAGQQQMKPARARLLRFRIIIIIHLEMLGRSTITMKTVDTYPGPSLNFARCLSFNFSIFV